MKFHHFKVDFIPWRWRHMKTFCHCNVPADFKIVTGFCRTPQKWFNQISILESRKLKNNLSFNFWSLPRYSKGKKSKIAESSQDTRRKLSVYKTFSRRPDGRLCMFNLRHVCRGDAITQLILWHNISDYKYAAKFLKYFILHHLSVSR